MPKLTHTNDAGKAQMVDVATKKTTFRRAVAQGRVQFNPDAFTQLEQNSLAKGDALGVARLAGIQAAKRTAELIPLCHLIPLDVVQIEIELEAGSRAAIVTATAAASWKTGVEMEALVAVSVACLTLYDMAKAVDRSITISEVTLLEKEGGRSGHWVRD
jgi:cyclic pyranopterin phosphate synthase